MEVRPIDAGSLKDNLTDIYGDSKNLVYIYDILDLIDKQPTFTPPNEPLTFTELEEMNGQPVYIPKLNAWGLINASENTIYNYNGWAINLYETSLMGIYRHPPEGEEDT